MGVVDFLWPLRAHTVLNSRAVKGKAEMIEGFGPWCHSRFLLDLWSPPLCLQWRVVIYNTYTESVKNQHGSNYILAIFHYVDGLVLFYLVLNVTFILLFYSWALLIKHQLICLLCSDFPSGITEDLLIFQSQQDTFVIIWVFRFILFSVLKLSDEEIMNVVIKNKWKCEFFLPCILRRKICFCIITTPNALLQMWLK